MMSTKVEGLRDVRSLMARVPQKMTNKFARRGTSKGARRIRDGVKIAAPTRIVVDGKQRRTGKLRRLIRTKSSRPRRGWVKHVVYYPTQGGRDDPKNAYFWRFVEFGTKYQPAQPYISVVARRMFNRVVEDIFDEIESGIRTEVRRT